MKSKAIKVFEKVIGAFLSSKVFLSIIILVIVVVGFSMAQGIGGPEKTINKFESSFNRGDLNGMLECVHPGIKAAYQGMTGFASDYVSFPVDSVMEGIVWMMTGVDHERRLQLDILVGKIEKNKDEAHAEVYMIMYEGNTMYDSTYEILLLNKIDDKWYLVE